MTIGGREAFPGLFGAFAGFTGDAKIENGYLKLPDRQNFGTLKSGESRPAAFLRVFLY